MLPGFVRTKRKLLGYGILRPTENAFGLDLGRMDEQGFRIAILAIQLPYRVSLSQGTAQSVYVIDIFLNLTYIQLRSHENVTCIEDAFMLSVYSLFHACT